MGSRGALPEDRPGPPRPRRGGHLRSGPGQAGRRLQADRLPRPRGHGPRRRPGHLERRRTLRPGGGCLPAAAGADPAGGDGLLPRRAPAHQGHRRAGPGDHRRLRQARPGPAARAGRAAPRDGGRLRRHPARRGLHARGPRPHRGPGRAARRRDRVRRGRLRPREGRPPRAHPPRRHRALSADARPLRHRLRRGAGRPAHLQGRAHPLDRR